MIYTVTFNPSLDYIVNVQNFRPGVVNRTATEKILPGGKGINVSIVLGNLGIDSCALGFVAGFTGDELMRRMEEFGCKTDFIRAREGITRINVKMMSGVEATEINGQGPAITEDEIRQLEEKLEKLQKGDLLVISGSIPSCLPADMYEKLLHKVEGKSIHTVVDATGELLRKVLPYHPFLIKPNHHELGELYGVQITDKENVVKYAKKLQEEGARNVLVSMGGEGSVLVTEQGEVYKAEAIKGKVVNTVGAGDSMVAGFIAGYITGKGDMLDAFRTGQAAGSASAFSANLATKEEVDALLQNL
jgi:1-phosphofructokinase